MTPHALKSAALDIYRSDHVGPLDASDDACRHAYIVTVPRAYARTYLARAKRALGMAKTLTAQGILPRNAVSCQPISATFVQGGK